VRNGVGGWGGGGAGCVCVGSRMGRAVNLLICDSKEMMQ